MMRIEMNDNISNNVGANREQRGANPKDAPQSPLSPGVTARAAAATTDGKGQRSVGPPQ